MLCKRDGILSSAVFCLIAAVLILPTGFAQSVTYKPYIQPGDNGPFESRDQMVVAWQTNEASPNASAYVVDFGKSSSYGRSVTPQARLVDNYLAADPSEPAGSCLLSACCTCVGVSPVTRPGVGEFGDPPFGLLCSC